jgi:RNA polymerase sigma factor (sigma-70 family)
MSQAGSVTRYLRGLAAGEQAAYQQLWERYYRRLVGLARERLPGRLGGAGDGEDVAAQAFDSFFRAAQQGRFPRLQDRDDLWQVLVVLTRRKAANWARDEGRARRGDGRVVPASALGDEAEEEGPAFAALLGREPDPAFAAEVAEECGRLLGLLADETLRSVAVAKMEGYTNEETAARLGVSVPTVERKLQRIRATWGKEVRR